MASESSVFGDDINSTPIGKLTMPPMSMSSKNDPGAPGPVEPPVYSPVVDTGGSGRHVTFDDHDYVQEIPSRGSRGSRGSRKSKKSKKAKKMPPSMPAFHPGYWPAGPPRAAPARPQKKQKRIFALAAAYAHQLTVAVLMVIVLWYYPKIVAFPYLGDGSGMHMSTVGIAAVAAAAGVAYGVIEHIVD